MGGQLLIKEFICLCICNISQQFCVDRSMKYKKTMKFSIIAMSLVEISPNLNQTQFYWSWLKVQ